MHAWEAIQKTLEEIENRIGEQISIEELAAAAALSPFYYQRLFSRLVKKPVREYIKLRRLARACASLRGTDNNVLSVAVEYGFGSHEGFTRTFKDTYGMTPTQYRESDVGLNNFDKPDLLLNYTMIDVGVPLISDGLVLEINKKTLANPIVFFGVENYVSIAGHFPNGKATGVNEPGEIWRSFGEVEDKIPGKPEGYKIGVAYHGPAPAGCFPYFVGKEADLALPSEDYKQWTLPAADYIVCRFEAETFEELTSIALNKAFSYIHMWQRKKELRDGDFGAEIYYYDPDIENPDVAFMEIWSLWLEGEENNG